MRDPNSTRSIILDCHLAKDGGECVAGARESTSACMLKCRWHNLIIVL